MSLSGEFGSEHGSGISSQWCSLANQGDRTKGVRVTDKRFGLGAQVSHKVSRARFAVTQLGTSPVRKIKSDRSD